MTPTQPDWAVIADTAVHQMGAIQKPAELATLLELLAAADVKVMVEVGSYAGGTLYAWQHICPDVITVDLPGTGTYAATGMEKQLHSSTAVFGDSHDPLTLETLKSVLPGPVDFLFIDGDHSYEGVKLDYQMYGPLVRPGGLIAFHDIVDHPDQPDIQVSRLWAELKTDDSEEIIDAGAPWGGIGVLHVSGN